MKKITLKNLNLKEVEQLSREQLKNVLGGYTGGTGDGTDGGTTENLCQSIYDDCIKNYEMPPEGSSDDEIILAQLLRRDYCNGLIEDC